MSTNRTPRTRCALTTGAGCSARMLLADITPDRIAKQRDKLLTEDTHRFAKPATGDEEADAQRPKAKRSGPTVNRYLAALSVCLSHGVKELRWLERNPCELIKKPKEARVGSASCPTRSA